MPKSTWCLLPDLCDLCDPTVDERRLDRSAPDLCDIANADGPDFEGCPRTTLRRVLDDAATCSRSQHGARSRVLPVPTRRATAYRSIQPTKSDRTSIGRRTIAATTRAPRWSAALQEMGLGDLERASRARRRINTRSTWPKPRCLRTADNFVTLRGAVKHVASGLGLDATFMPKPAEDVAGNGLHVYFGLGGLDEDQRLHAIGGLLAHAPGSTAVCNPTVNSYKRLVAAWDAPIYTVWSEAQRERARARSDRSGHGQPMIEMRSPDPSCNPYLAFAVLIEVNRRRPAPSHAPGRSVHRIELRAHRKIPQGTRDPYAAEIAAPGNR